MDAFAGEQERQVKKLIRQLASWREVILRLHSVLTWDQKWYPGLIFGAVSTLYLLLWLVDPPILTMIAGTGITLTLMDFLVPTLIANIYPHASWSKNKQKLYEEICKSVVIHYNWIFITCQSFYRMRESSSRVYYMILIVLLSIVAWIGATINNLIVFYMTSLFICLVPGLLNNERLSIYFTQFMHYINRFFKSREKAD